MLSFSVCIQDYVSCISNIAYFSDTAFFSLLPNWLDHGLQYHPEQKWPERALVLAPDFKGNSFKTMKLDPV